jgi:energy-coupling factor transport system ATP-binding protein
LTSASQVPTVRHDLTPLRARGVSFVYGAGTAGEVRALDDVTFRIEPGSFTLVMGATGSGKSTLLRILSGLQEPATGSVQLTDGTPVRPGDIGLVFQNPESQLFEQTVFDDIAFGIDNLRLAKTPGDREEMVRAALQGVGLDPEEFAPRSPFTLSGGEARKVAIAGTLALRRRFVLFDEPSAGLDAAGCEAVHALIRNLVARGAGVVVVSHDVDEFLPHAHRVLLLKGGKVSWAGPALELIGDVTPLEDAGLKVPALLDFQRRLGAQPGTLTYDVAQVAAWAVGGPKPAGVR